MRKGLADEKIIPASDPHIYEGTDARNRHYHGWNVSNELPIPREHHKKTDEE
jgi:hypothetical protein